MDDGMRRYDYAATILRQVGHDLKSPLTAIIGAFEAILSLGAKLSEQQKELLCKTGLKEAHRLQHFIHNIMLMAKLEEGGISIEKTPVKLDRFFEEMARRLQREYPHVTWKNETPYPVGDVYVDQRWFAEAVWQIMDNIGKHNLQPVHCAVTISQGDSQGAVLEMTIQDDGVGISNEWRSNIFDKYFKGPVTQLQDASAGLGLTIAQHIIEAHNGSLDSIGGLPGSSGTGFLIHLNS